MGGQVNSDESEEGASEVWLAVDSLEEATLGPEEGPMELEDAPADEEDEGGFDEELGKKEHPVNPMSPVSKKSLVTFFMWSPSSCCVHVKNIFRCGQYNGRL